MINIRQQKDNHKVTIRKQIGNNKITIRQQKGNHKITERKQQDNHKVTEMHQDRDVTELTYEDVLSEINRLVGLQKNILFYVVQRCLVNGNLLSGPITMEMLKTATGANDMCIKTSIYRLIHRGLFEREPGKKGMGGFSIFSVNDLIRRAAMQEMEIAKISHQIGNHKVTETPPSSSNIYINNTTTSEGGACWTEDTGDSCWSDEWETIDIWPLADINFNKHCLEQIRKQGKLTSKEVQESIWAFDFDLRENNKWEKVQGKPLNYFMGILRKGVPYIPPQNYMSPLDKALEEYLTMKRRADTRRKKMEEEAQDLAYADWLQELPQDKIQEIIPETRYQEEPFRSGMLKKYFTEHVWPGVLSGVQGASSCVSTAGTTQSTAL